MADESQSKTRLKSLKRALDFNIADKYIRAILYAIGGMGVLILGVYTLKLLGGFFRGLMNVALPFILAFILAYVMAPVVIALQRRYRLGRVGGTFALYSIVLALLLFVTAIVLPGMLTQLMTLRENLRVGIPQTIERVTDSPWMRALFTAESVEGITAIENGATSDTVQSGGNNDQATSEGAALTNTNGAGSTEVDATPQDSGDETAQRFGAWVRQNLENFLKSAQPLAEGGFDMVAGIWGGVMSFAGWMTFLAFVGIINFYIILDWEKIQPTFRLMAPPKYRERVFAILQKVDTAVGGFLRGQLTTSALVGVMFTIGLFAISFFGFPALRNYSILIGMAAMIGGFVPYLGAVMGLTPAVILVLLTPDASLPIKITTLILIVGLFSAIQAIEGFVLQPRIVGKGAGLHPLAVMLALLAGAQFGFTGLVLAVPMACVTRVLVKELYWEPLLARENNGKQELEEAAGDPDQPDPPSPPGEQVEE